MKTTRLALACLLALLACSPAPPSRDAGARGLPSDPPLMRGRVTRVDAARVRVEENPNEQSGSAKAELDIDARTAVLARDGSPGPALRAADGERVGRGAGNGDVSPARHRGDDRRRKRTLTQPAQPGQAPGSRRSTGRARPSGESVPSMPIRRTWLLAM